jgi:hypothetical protein
MSTTMASTLPHLSPPVMGPPTSALPPIPTANKPPRKSLPVPTGPSKIITDQQSPPKLRIPSSPRPSALPTTQHSTSSPNIPTLRSSSSLSKSTSTLPERTIRKTISINSFHTRRLQAHDPEPRLRRTQVLPVRKRESRISVGKVRQDPHVSSDRHE